MAQAESCFAKALELAPERPSVLMNLGVVKAALGQTTQAIDLLLRSAEHEPEAIETWVHLGAAYAETGQFPMALVTVKPSHEDHSRFIVTRWCHKDMSRQWYGRS